MSKQWSWAEEVVRVAGDPQNQWELMHGEHSKPSLLGQSWSGQPTWADPWGPKERGGDIVLKAQERAKEVQRLEREQQRHIYGIPDKAGLRPFA